MPPSLSVAFNHDQTRASFTIGHIVTAEIVSALRSALEGIAQNHHLKLITIEGIGRDFSFGASIPEHAADQIGGVLPDMHRLILDLLDAPAATAAVVRGRCLGGGFEIALACDFIFAADDAHFGLPEVTLGVFPPAGAALLPLRIGTARATSAVVTGTSLAAGEWRDAGLVEFVSAPESLAGDVDAWFERCLALKSAAAIRYAAAAARATLLARVRETLPHLEQLYLTGLMTTADAVEGIAAFMEKRPPRWTDQ
jgi:cyclohexa-1,5-dienecarbonyl-CoA hydratase